jgi:hypothetical protein
MRIVVTCIVVCSAALAGHFAIVGSQSSVADTNAAESNIHESDVAPSVSPNGLVLHEWGTFTSFSGSNGAPVSFRPNNSDLPGFVYYHAGDAFSKSDRLSRYGTVSMETPVMYFYTDKAIQASVKVDFPKGWITEWYPRAATAPDENPQQPKKRVSMDAGETIRWSVKLLPGEPAHFPHENGENPYYHARETDSVALQTTFQMPDNPTTEPIRGGSIAQHEKFLFYRGVGTFSPPVTVSAMGGGKVRVLNGAGGRVTGLVLLTVRNGRIGFQALDDLEGEAEAVATIPEATNTAADLGTVVEKGLIAAGLYEREAQAMVKTWDHAWFHEQGTRLLYILPRTRTDELLPITVSPQPAQVVRVMVGRHDFLTPEQESSADQQVARINAAKAELAAAEAELVKLGRFSLEAQQMAGQRLEAKTK